MFYILVHTGFFFFPLSFSGVRCGCAAPDFLSRGVRVEMVCLMPVVAFSSFPGWPFLFFPPAPRECARYKHVFFRYIYIFFFNAPTDW